MNKNPLLAHVVCGIKILYYLRIMRISVFLTFVCVCQLWASNTEAQNAVISMSTGNMSIRNIINEIEQQTDYLVVFSNREVDVDKNVYINDKTGKVSDYLNIMSDASNLKYEYENNYIVLTNKNNPVNLSINQQGRKISGIVKDQYGEAIIGANVVEKGTTNGTITGLDGDFNLTVSENATLQISYIGYNTTEVSVAGKTSFMINLTEDSQTLDEVVVVGYGVQKKRDVTGSISQVKGEDLKNIPTASIANTMQGRVSGVEFVSGGTGPGSAPSIRIRGTGTLNSAEPLVIVDGIATESGAIRDYNPNDVESIEILKDASASAIYGTRAANGVVIITTKKGQKNEKISVSLNAYTGVTNVQNTLDLTTAPELVMLKKERYTNNGLEIDPFWNDSYYSTQRTDWQKEYYSTGKVHNVDLSLKGGSEKSTFYSSIGYYNEQGMIKPQEFKRYSIRINSDHQVSKRLKVGESIQYSLMNTADARGGVYDVLRFNPAIPVKNEDGTWGTVGGRRDHLGDLNNPIMKNAIEKDKYSIHRLQGAITFDFTILDGLILKGNYGVNAKILKESTFLPLIKDQPFPRPEAELTKRYHDEYRLVAETFLSYYKTFNKVHTVNVSAGFSAEKYKGDEFAAERRVFSDESEDQQYLNNGQRVQNAEGIAKPESSLASYFARAFYSYMDKYLLTATLRADGSSKFAKGNRWGTFPAFSLGWRLSEEEFMKNIEFLSNLKLTGGWGSLGNQNISDFQYLATIEKGGGNWNMYNFGGNYSYGSTLKQLGNPSITWEKTYMTNLGIEAGFLNNRLNTSVTYFNKNTVDILLSTVEVGTLGQVDIPPSNIGEMNNKGFEIEVSFQDQVGKDFFYNIGMNASFIKNKVTKLYGNNVYLSGSGYGNNGTIVSRTYEGQPIGSFFGWKTDGLYQTQNEIDNDPYLKNDDQARVAGIKPGDVRFVDTNGDGKIDEADRVNLGHPHPKAMLGLFGKAGYKGFDLSFNFVSNLGVKLYNADKMIGIDGTQNYNLYKEALDRWHGEGTSNSVPRMTLPAYNLNNNYRASDLFIENGDYLMLKNLTIGYNLPMQIISKIGLSNLRLYATGQNLFTLTGYSGNSPELGYTDDAKREKGVGVAWFPTSRTFSFGVTIDL